MDPWLNYHHLLYFRTIANEGSVSKAAEKLRLGQPTLSAQLKTFEDRLGTPLFERKNRKLFLTQAGLAALDYANEIFRLGSEMMQVVHHGRTADCPKLRLGALDTISKKLVFDLVRAALSSTPCTVSVNEGNDDELLRELLAHRIDILFTNQVPTVGDGKKIYSRQVARLATLFCGAPKFKKLRDQYPESLNQAPMILPTLRCRLRHDIDHYLRTLKLQPNILAEVQDTALLKLMALEGLGIVPLAEASAVELIENRKLIPIGQIEGVHQDLFLVSASRRIDNPISTWFFKHFRLNDLWKRQ
jgi:LysR family transcriptional activator of nhaA